MSMCRGLIAAAGFAFALGVSGAVAETPGLGKPISEADLALWDMSIPPDGKGLPPGSGTAEQGAAIYAQKCELCHGKNGYGGKSAELINPPDKNERNMA